jgi:hypothetical protein
MTKEALIRRLQISCLGLDPIDPLRLLVDDVIAALAQPEQDHIPDARKMVTEQEPDIYPEEAYEMGLEAVAYYTTPPQRKPLTDVIITQVIDSMPKKMKGFMVDWDLYEFARAIEAKLKEKNT